MRHVVATLLCSFSLEFSFFKTRRLLRLTLDVRELDD